MSKSTHERFGYEWSTYTEIAPIHKEHFCTWMPFIKPDEWKGLTYLDVGCGIGRNSYWPMTFGAAGCRAIDLDERTLEVAKKNLAQFETAIVEKCSAYEIGDEDKYDVTFSIGVIHHLDDPSKALEQMFKATKPGGRMCIWVYGYENNEWIVNWFDPFRRAIFSRLPIGFVHWLSLWPTLFLRILLHLGWGRVAYYDLLRKYPFHLLRSIVFDQMLPQIANYWRREEVEELMKKTGLENIELLPVNGLSWAARGYKPKRAT